MQPSYVSKAAIKPGAVAEAGEIDKDEKHDKVVTQAGGHFYPLIVETLGHCPCRKEHENKRNLMRFSLIS